MTIYDRQWFKDVRAVLDNANGLKDCPPQDDVTAGVVQIPTTKSEEPPEGWHVYWQNGLYGRDDFGSAQAGRLTSTICLKHALLNCAVCRIEGEA